ncbi:MAG: histidine kinase [Bacteroidales bacterium]|nr:histidine kinase [Bacteroidales bacterium]
MGNELFSNFRYLIKHCFFGFVLTVALWKGTACVGVYVERKFPWERNPSLTLTFQVLAAVTYAALAILIINLVFLEFYYKTSIKENFKLVLFQMIIELGIAMLITTIFYVKSFFISWRKAAVSEERYKQEALQLQYETLKSYVNPHFLFNSLSVLSSLVEKDTQKSQLFIRQLSDIYRYVLEQKGKELVPLETELDFARSFINLHKIRHGENLKVQLDVEDNAGYIVPLSMQILLENAFKHNVISEEEPLLVKVWRDHDYIIVQNQIRKRKTIEAGSGTGLETIVNQYKFISSRTLLICADDGNFTVHVPILNQNILNQSN